MGLLPRVPIRKRHLPFQGGVLTPANPQRSAAAPVVCRRSCLALKKIPLRGETESTTSERARYADWIEMILFTVSKRATRHVIPATAGIYSDFDCINCRVSVEMNGKPETWNL